MGPPTPTDAYRVIDVKPIDRLLERYVADHESGSDESVLQEVRGHHKTYEGERLLFGKLSGRYYWGPQVRGNVDKGTRTKDYLVNVPGQLSDKGSSFDLGD